MKKISVLLLRSYLGPFVISFVIWLFIFELQFLWKYIDDLIGKGLPLSVVGELLVYASAPLVTMALPVAILLSSIMTMGNLSEHFELTAMKSAGMSLFKIMRPLIAFILVVSISAFLFANNVMPVATLKFKTLLFSVTKKAPTLEIRENVFYSDIDGYVIRAKENDTETGEMKDVLIYDHSENQGNRRVIRAESGKMNLDDVSKYMVITLFNGVSYDEPVERGKTESKKKHPSISSKFEKNIIRIDISSLAFEQQDEDMFSHREEMMTIQQLENGIDSLGRSIKKMQIERLAQSQNSIRYTADTSLAQIDSIRYDSIYFFNSLAVNKKKRALDKAINLSRKNREYNERTVKQLESKIHRINIHNLEWHRKIFLGVSCIVLFFVGAPLGAITRKGGYGFPTIIALCLFVLYFILSTVGVKMVKAGTLEPWQGVWLSSFVLIPLALFLTYKAARDSSITDGEFYKKIWLRITELFKRKKVQAANEDTPTL
ncbi:MAG: LptF/LptG family permease [Flavobacteriales bacterium]